MSEILLLKFLHLLLFVYWLGGDLGVFYSSNYVVKDDISVEARQIASKIMFWLDQAPRICMTLILPVGVHLAVAMQYIQLDKTGLSLVWLVCLAWLANVTILHLLHQQAIKKVLENIDFFFRVLLVLGLSAIAIYALLSDELIPQNWLALKLLIFALLVACGLTIRIFLKPFIPEFVKMLQQGATEEGNAIMKQSLTRCRYVVVTLWLGLLINAALGMHLISV